MADTTDATSDTISKYYAESQRRKERNKVLAEQNTKLKFEYEQLKSQYENAAKEVGNFKAELESYKAQPNELKEQLEKVKGELRTRDHRDVFRKVAGNHKVRVEALDDLWTLSNYQAETDVPDEEAISGLVANAVKDRPWLVGDQVVEVAKALTPGPGFSRGSSQGENTGKVKVSKAQRQDPAWVMANEKWLNEMRTQGRLEAAD